MLFPRLNQALFFERKACLADLQVNFMYVCIQQRLYSKQLELYVPAKFHLLTETHLYFSVAVVEDKRKLNWD